MSQEDNQIKDNLSEQIELARARSREISNILHNFFEPQQNMLTLNIDPLKYLSRIPEFTGDYKDLQNFIDLIDKIHPILLRYDALSQSIFSDHIKSKLRGKAREVIEINAHTTSWPDIKQILVNNFGDRLTIEELFDELRATKFRTNSVEFYNDIKSILRRLNTKTKLTITDEDELVTNTIETNKCSALAVFKNKLPEPMRSILHCRDPDSLESAMNILYECGYAYYNPGQTRTQTNFQNNKPTTRNNTRNNNQLPRRNFNSQTSNPRPRTPPHQNNLPRNPYAGNNPRQGNYFPRQFQNNSNNYHNPYNNNFNNSNSPNFGQNAYNANNRQNINHNNSNNRLDRPEPMEVDLLHEERNEANTQQPVNFHSQASKAPYPI